MTKETASIIRRMERVLAGEPWYGRPVFTLLKEVNEEKVFVKSSAADHSMIEILYHMITWSAFTLKRIENDDATDLVAFEKMDWRKINPRTHNWKKGVTEFKSVQKKIISRLKKKDDAFLEQIVDCRKYNFRFLLHGMIDHHIYHVGQIVMLNKQFG